MKKTVVLILISFCFSKPSFSQDKDYLDVSKVMTRIELSFSTDLSFYHSNTLNSPFQYKLFASPEYTFQGSFNFEVSQTVFLSPIIGLSYSVRRTPFDDGVHTTTSGIEHVSYYLKSCILGFNAGIGGEWQFRKKEKRIWSLISAVLYSRTVYSDSWSSVSVDGYPDFTGRPKDMLMGNLSIGHTFIMNRAFSIKPVAGISYRFGFSRISGPEHIAKIFPVSPMVGVSFIFDTSSKEQL